MAATVRERVAKFLQKNSGRSHSIKEIADELKEETVKVRAAVLLCEKHKLVKRISLDPLTFKWLE